MDALIIAGFILGVLALMAWIFTMAAITYVLWKYVFIPWKVMRNDVQYLSNKVKTLEAQQSRERVLAVDDAHAARAEARLNARARAGQQVPQ